MLVFIFEEQRKKSMKAVEIFDKLWERYDSWYERNKDIFIKEINFIRKHLGEFKLGLEVGVGTGRFAKELGIRYGIDLSTSMLKLAKSRGIEVVKANAELIPFKRVFDLILYAFTLCFLEDPIKSLKSARDVLIEGGKVVICTVPKDSKLAEEYMNRRDNPFYSNARFYTTSEVVKMLEDSGFKVIKIDFEDIKYGRDLLVVVAVDRKDVLT